MSFRIGELFDQVYACPTCNISALDSSTVNRCSWTCLTCGRPRPDLPIGITLATRTQINKGGKGSQLIFNFKVNRLGSKQTTVYIGTEFTWEHNFDAALEKAIAIRERSKQAVKRQRK